MSDLFDYLEWRGDLTFDKDPFHDLDALILSQISYFSVEHIMREDESLTLGEIWDKLKDGDLSSRFTEKTDRRFLEALSLSDRYKDLTVTNLVHKLDENLEMQFTALTVLLPDGTPYLSYRGTDISMVGWKEDLALAYSDIIPGQRMAVEYLKLMAAAYQKPLYLGGHSKGGNLALYSATVCPEEIQNLIKGVYVYDGPGLTEELFHSDSYARIKDRVHAVLPDQSMVGVLLMHPEEYTVVKSSKSTGVTQHNPLTWQVLGTHFVLAEDRKKDSRYVETVTRKWVEENKEEDLKSFADAMFDVLHASETESIEELLQKIKKNPALLFQAYRGTDEETQKAFKTTMSAMAGTAIHEAKAEFREATSEIKELGKAFTLQKTKKLLDLLPGKNAEDPAALEQKADMPEDRPIPDASFTEPDSETVSPLNTNPADSSSDLTPTEDTADSDDTNV
ncbi:MAG: DUF2974 domain-containing protein [Clostridiales bacterium]|nr:DUF2974 domain-containing protein [Candidatus Blautia equi]